ncbi:hypothetical protein ACHAXS_000204, partial [Conticribra weissflogii]
MNEATQGTQDWKHSQLNQTVFQIHRRLSLHFITLFLPLLCDASHRIAHTVKPAVDSDKS